MNAQVAKNASHNNSAFNGVQSQTEADEKDSKKGHGVERSSIW